MKRFDFSKINKDLSIFDTDYMDIKRQVGSKLEKIYSNVPCHAVFMSTDNPDSTRIDVVPVIMSIKIYYNEKDCKIKNDDYIILKKADKNNKLLGAYAGRSGNPSINQSRSMIVMGMKMASGVDDETIDPLPPLKPCTVTCIYKNSDGETLHDDFVQVVETGETVFVSPTEIEGYKISKMIIDGVEQVATETSFITTKQSYSVEFIYEVAQTLPTYFRQLIPKGLYTSTDGAMASGAHFYAKININSISGSNGNYTINSPIKSQTHDDQGKTYTIAKGTKLKMSNGEWCYVNSTVSGTSSTGYTFETISYTPTSAEENAVETEWYDS